MQYFHLNFCKCLVWKLMKWLWSTFWNCFKFFEPLNVLFVILIHLEWCNRIIFAKKILILLRNRIIMFTSANGLHYSPFKCYNIIQYNSNVLLSKNKWVKHIYFQSHILQTLPLLVIENLHNNNLLSCCPINEIYMKIEELVCPEKSRLTLAWTL